MTRKQRIESAKAFTKREKGLEALAKRSKLYLESTFLEVSAKDLYEKGMLYDEGDCFDVSTSSLQIEYRKPRIWAFNSQGIATTQF